MFHYFFALRYSYFYPRSPCGERLVNGAGLSSCFGISIHALLAESDSVVNSTGTMGKSFLSTLSLRRATAPNRRSCHCNKNFYPRSPCGERQPRKTEAPGAIVFLSTLSLRRATQLKSAPFTKITVISIHALLAESDAGLILFFFCCILISIHALLAESDCTILTQKFCV